MVEPSCAGLVASSPPDPVQVVGLGLQVSGGEGEQAFDLGDGQCDHSPKRVRRQLDIRTAVDRAALVLISVSPSDFILP